MGDIAPLHDLSLGKGEWRVNATAFGPDGVLYVHFWDKTLNLWNLVSSFWPEALGGVLAVLAIVAVVAWSRVKRRPQVRGALHCRTCNYHLAGIGAGLCPECGVDPSVSRPLVGRGAARRMRTPLLVLAVLAVAYAGLIVGGVKRGAAFDLLRWPAPKLAAWAEREKIKWIGRFNRHECSIVSVDPATGKTSRVIHGLGMTSTFGLSISPDGRTLLTTLRDGDLVAIDLKSRRIVRRVARLDVGAARAVYPPDGWVHVAGWPDAATVYVQFANGTSQRNELRRWDLKSGTMMKVCDLNAWQSGPGGRPVRIYAVKAAGGKGIQEESWIGLERLAGSAYGVVSDIIVRDLSDGDEIGRLRGGFWGEAAPVAAADGQFYIRHWGGGADIGLWSIGDEEMLGDMDAPGFMGTLQHGPAGLAFDVERSRLFIATTNPHVVHVRDTASKTWLPARSNDAGGEHDARGTAGAASACRVGTRIRRV